MNISQYIFQRSFSQNKLSDQIKLKLRKIYFYEMDEFFFQLVTCRKCNKCVMWNIGCGSKTVCPDVILRINDSSEPAFLTS